MPQLTGHSTVDKQYHRLRAGIIDGTYAPGTVLLETAISKEFGVSRTPAREALTRLTQDGWVVRSQRGYQVRVRSVDEIVDLYDARIALESTAAELAAERRTSTDLALIEHCLASREAASDSSDQSQLNKQWHVTVIQAGHNATIARYLDDVRAQLQIYRKAYEAARFEAGDTNRELSEHQLITTAIRNRDGEAARLLMTTHLAHGRTLRIAALQRDTNA